ncbi:hypothetical protein Glove_87g240 [Diversispora epigaea]|uniref:BTB domain-containing protein n=1 Tax=Diversispora epigaea TaxID=1348612 RepID=A0A397J666_9GLOM|nr:hypothetical protein Glove_87g240 [Diversispora epigaea]
MSFKFFDNYLKIFQNFLMTKKNNVVIEVDKEENMKSFTTHSVILRYQLSVKFESYLIESKASWLKTHFSFGYHSIFDKGFTSLHETALISILKRNDLKVEEIKIWDYVIKWELYKLKLYLKEWSKENFEALKITPQQCLPLIRYFHIPVEVIWKKIKPYKKNF